MKTMLVSFVRWYLAPSGLLFGATVVLLAYGLTNRPGASWVALAGIAGLAVFVPYRLAREQRRVDSLVASTESRLRTGLAASTESVRSQVVDQVSRLDRTARELESEIRNVRHGLGSAIAKSERSIVNRFEVTDGVRSRSISDLQNAIDERDRAHSEYEQMLAEASSNLASLQARLEDLSRALSTQDENHQTLAASVETERSDRLAAFARYSAGPPPTRLSLLATVPRSGSTWLFDMIRTLPSVYVEPSSTIWDELRLVGRRYPRALGAPGNAGTPMEASAGVGAVLPTLKGVTNTGSIALEKLHPEFFGFTPANLITAMHQYHTRHGTEICLIVLLRNPLEVMWSIARYKQRDPAWYQQLEPDQIPRFVGRCLTVLEGVLDQANAYLIDYRDLFGDESATAHVFQSVDDSVGFDDAVTLVKQARLATDRQARRSSQTGPFLASTANSNVVDTLGPDKMWIAVQQDVEDALETYRRTLKVHRPEPTP